MIDRYQTAVSTGISHSSLFLHGLIHTASSYTTASPINIRSSYPQPTRSHIRALQLRSAAPHPRAGVLTNTCLLTSGIFEATPGTGRLRAGSPGLGSGTATAHTRLSARGAPRSPPYAALPQFSCMGKTVFAFNQSPH